MSDANTAVSGNGFLVDVEPARPRQQQDWNPSPRPDQAVTQQQPISYGQPPAQPQVNPVDEIRQRLEAESEKLRQRLEEQGQQLKALMETQNAEQAEKARLQKEADDARRAREESEMDVKSLLSKKEEEWTSRIGELEKARERDLAVFEKERAYSEAQDYRRDRLEQESEFILPELRDFVTGSTMEEIDAQIEIIKSRSAVIYENIAQTLQRPTPFSQGRAAAPTAPPVGPMETMGTMQNLTPDDIKGMSMEDYKHYRDQLLRATNPRRR